MSSKRPSEYHAEVDKDEAVERNNSTSKIGFAPVKNLTASAYASDFMHFPSREGRSYMNCIPMTDHENWHGWAWKKFMLPLQIDNFKTKALNTPKIK